MSSHYQPTYYYTSVDLIWLFVSPLIVLWDIAYVILRPYSMPGGCLHRPIWIPYGLYGEVDHLYGLQSLENGDGLVIAFAMLNFVESCLYLWCAWKVVSESKSKKSSGRFLRVQERHIEGCEGCRVLLLVFATSLMVCVKTILYGMNTPKPRHTA